MAESTHIQQSFKWLRGALYVALLAVAFVAGRLSVALFDHGTKISVTSATYGKNCDKKIADGNVTKFLAEACNGRGECSYTVDVNTIGDPAGGCAKEFVATWVCSNNPAPHTLTLPAEAGLGSIALLGCM